MNKTSFLIFFFLLLMSEALLADKFRFIEVNNNDTNDFSNVYIKVFDTGGTLVFDDYTDGFGRININLPKGDYVTQVWFPKGEKQYTFKTDFWLNIVGSNKLKNIFIHSKY